MSVSGQRGPGDSALGMGVRLTLWADCACRFPLRLPRARPDRDCDGGIVRLGQQSEWGGTPANGLVSVSMSSCRWGCPWPQEPLQVRRTTWEVLGAGFCRPTGRLVNAGDTRPSWLPSWVHLALLFSVPHGSPTIGCSSWKRSPRTTDPCVSRDSGEHGAARPGSGASPLPLSASVLMLTGACRFPKACP